MSLNNAIPAWMIIEAAKKNGYMEQKSLIKTPPEYTLPEEYFVDVPVGYKQITEDGQDFGVTAHEYHPGFVRLRKELEMKGYIETQQWHNGDTVLKRFRLNEAWFEVGDRFLSPYACLNDIKRKLLTF